MIILSWNIQNGKGTDDIISLERIAQVIREMCDPDVICLQEVARNLDLDGSGNAPDQPAEIAALFPGYEVIFGVAVEAAPRGGDSRWQFGNLTLSRRRVLSVFHHPLPHPAEAGTKHMPRQAVEVTVQGIIKPIRIVNTHLEFHSARQRMMQVRRLHDLHVEIRTNNESPPNHDQSGPYQEVVRSQDSVMCGDFNMETSFDEYDVMVSPPGASAPVFSDAWRLVHSKQPHAPTCGIFDHGQWPNGPHCRDFFFVSPGVAASVTDVQVNTSTNASDHQPLTLELSEVSG